MKVGATHLTYCTNVHPGETWTEVRQNLDRYVCGVRDLVRPEATFGVGLRLSANAASTLDDPAELDEFESFLSDRRLYLFTLNGFPYGPFHGQAVKSAVYQPDWTRPERGVYTERLIRILCRLLPEGTKGSISSVPGGFRRDLESSHAVPKIVGQLHDQVIELSRAEREHGREITLALEPEPGCLLETTEDAVKFFERELLARPALEKLGSRLGMRCGDAERLIRKHLGICLDACHAAVEFEEPQESVARLRSAGITIAKLQASTGLRLPQLGAETLEALRPYSEPVYLHQVVARSRNDELLRFDDLPDAFASSQARTALEWRVHFHVPVYRDRLGKFANTQPYLDALLRSHASTPVTDHVEVETYTWDVLPSDQRSSDLTESLARELRWVEERLLS